jgi:hypothetical protein
MASNSVIRSLIGPSSRPLIVALNVYKSIHMHSRQSFGWVPRFRGRTVTPPEDDAVRQNEEEAAKSAILEKAFESRQPADLMLRCELSSPSFRALVSDISLVKGTILDAEGQCFVKALELAFHCPPKRQCQDDQWHVQKI